MIWRRRRTLDRSSRALYNVSLMRSALRDEPIYELWCHCGQFRVLGADTRAPMPDHTLLGGRICSYVGTPGDIGEVVW